jgi:uncharacterized sodium:solute symporter family permease YidK
MVSTLPLPLVVMVSREISSLVWRHCTLLRVSHTCSIGYVSAILIVGTVYSNIGGRNHLANASTVLGCLAIVLIIPIYVFYWYGPKIRAKSPFAQKVEAARQMEKEMLPVVERS